MHCGIAIFQSIALPSQTLRRKKCKRKSRRGIREGMKSELNKYALLVGGLEHFLIFPYIGNNHPNWFSYFSEEVKPPTRLVFICNPPAPSLFESDPNSYSSEHRTRVDSDDGARHEFCNIVYTTDGFLQASLMVFPIVGYDFHMSTIECLALEQGRSPRNEY